MLKDFIERARSARRRRRQAHDHLVIGERVSLERLRALPSFARWEQDMLRCLGEIGHL